MKAIRTAATLVGCAMVISSVVAGVAAADNPHGTPPGQAKKEQTQAANSQPTTSDNSTGVKPSSTTDHNTTAAGSNKTKQYGNGKTAGQIAMQNGASADTPLHGPGNSQPHKVAVCSKNGKSHQVDVHALKSHRANAC